LVLSKKENSDIRENEFILSQQINHMKLLIFTTVIFLFLTFLVNAQQYSLLATVTVKPIYNLTLGIEIITKKVLAGDNLNVSIKLNKSDLTEIKEEITVDLAYEILKPNKKVLDSGFAGKVKVKDYNKTTIQIPIPNIKPGRYILNITTTHPQAIPSSDSDDFSVKEKLRLGSFSILEYFNFLIGLFG